MNLWTEDHGRIAEKLRATGLVRQAESLTNDGHVHRTRSALAETAGRTEGPANEIEIEIEIEIEKHENSTPVVYLHFFFILLL